MPTELIRQMRSRDFYPHEVTQEIQLVQTHISYVLLTGQYAYKVKKAVDLGFLDFSALEQRKHFCEEELRLNRRFAPRLYLEVVPIYRSEGGFSFVQAGPAAEPVEYALKMRQFREEDLLIHCLERGEIREAHMRDVAVKMVAAHAAAASNASIAAFGAPDRIHSIMDENFDVTRTHVGQCLTAKQFGAIRDGVYEILDQDHALLAARAGAGRTRECHGDLHLRNMCWFEGEIQFFDCIEFNKKFRYIDVMYELAFLAMDLEYRSAPALANVVMNAYLEESGDYEGATLLPMYMAVRALVRGNVSSILLDEPDVAQEEREHALASAREHFAYATGRVSVDHRRLILTCGLSGVGKTSTARELAKRLGAIHLRSDAIRKHLHGVPLREHSTRIYTKADTTQTYERLVELATSLLKHGWPVILDATFRDASFRNTARETAESLEAPFTILHLHARPGVLEQRVGGRRGDASDATPDLVAEQAAQFDPFTDAERPHVVDIDSDNPIDYEALARRFRSTR